MIPQSWQNLFNGLFNGVLHWIRQVLRSAFFYWFGIGLVLTINLAACTNTQPTASTSSPSPTPSVAAASPKNQAVRIGYQKSSELAILKSRGDLEKRLNKEGYTVTWNLFQAGPPLLEALNTGNVDFGGTGELPPIFAQAAGAKLTYVASTDRNPETQAIVVAKDSPIQQVADLKGKKVAFVKGSSAHYQLIKALQEANLSPSDIEAANLPPADGRIAFEQGKVDAWVVWDPFLAAAESTGNVRILKQSAKRQTYMLASQDFAKTQAPAIKIILEELKATQTWASNKPKEVAELLAPDLGIPIPVTETVVKRQGWNLNPITEDLVKNQQGVADIFFDLKLIPTKINIKEAILTPEEYSKFTPK